MCRATLDITKSYRGKSFMKSELSTILYLRTDISNELLIAGGSVSHTIGVISGFIKHGYRMIVASSIMQAQIQEFPIARFCNLSNPRFFSFLRWKINCLLSNFFFTAQVMRFIHYEPISYIYQRYGILNCVGVLVSKIKKIPLVLEYNGSETWVAKEWAVQKKFRMLWLIEKIEMLNLRRANHIIVVSEPLKEELINRGIAANKILVNPNGVDPEFFNPDKLKIYGNEIMMQYRIPQNAFVIGFVGTFSQWHGIETLAEIIKELKNKKDIYFMLIGDGPLKKKFEHEIAGVNQDHCIMPGMLAHSIARNYLAACDAFISPNQPNKDGSRFFGSPTKLFEYMSLAKPVIASDLEQLAHVIKPAVRADSFANKAAWKEACGFLAQSNKAEEFCAAIKILSDSSRQERELVGKNARSEILNYYSWDKHAARIDEFARGKE
jgi:glycosyltransferase involved in cell wall biosynthesis